MHQPSSTPVHDKTHLRHLNTIQRTPLIRILLAFRTVATAALEVETLCSPGTPPSPPLRLIHHIQATHATSRPTCLGHIDLGLETQKQCWNKRALSVGRRLKTMNADRLNELETIDPRPQPPSRLSAFTEIETGLGLSGFQPHKLYCTGLHF
jgi:hypothetical protein